MNPEKCNFLESEVKNLGLIISEYGVQTDPNKIGAVSWRPLPYNKADIFFLDYVRTTKDVLKDWIIKLVPYITWQSLLEYLFGYQIVKNPFKY